MSADLLERLCVRTSVFIKGQRENQGSGFIIKDGDSFYVVTAHHCIFGDSGEYQNITPDNIFIEHQKENYLSPFNRIEVEDLVNSNKQEDWALLRISDPKLTADFSKIKLGISSQENIDVKFCGYQQVSPTSYRPFDAKLLSLAPDQFRITLKDKSFSQGSEEGSFNAKGLSGSGVGIEYNDTLYLIGILKSVIGNEALNDDIECCSISCLSETLMELEPITDIVSKSSKHPDIIDFAQDVLRHGTIHLVRKSVEVPEWGGPAKLSFSVTNLGQHHAKLSELRLVVKSRIPIEDVQFPLAGAPVEEFFLKADVRDCDEVDLIKDLDVQFIMKPGESEAFKLLVTAPEGYILNCEIEAALADIRTGEPVWLEPASVSITAPIMSVETLRKRREESHD